MGMVVFEVGMVVTGFVLIFTMGVFVSDDGRGGCWVCVYFWFDFCSGVVVLVWVFCEKECENFLFCLVVLLKMIQLGCRRRFCKAWYGCDFSSRKL